MVVSLRKMSAGYVERELQARIQDGTLAAGTPLRQRDIALELGVSHTPVREALSRLRAKGYVSSELHPVPPWSEGWGPPPRELAGPRPPGVAGRRTGAAERVPAGLGRRRGAGP